MGPAGTGAAETGAAETGAAGTSAAGMGTAGTGAVGTGDQGRALLGRAIRAVRADRLGKALNSGWSEQKGYERHRNQDSWSGQGRHSY